jgi:hypothetical protein
VAICGKSLDPVFKGLDMCRRGWWNYFRLTEAGYILKELKTCDFGVLFGSNGRTLMPEYEILKSSASTTNTL